MTLLVNHGVYYYMLILLLLWCSDEAEGARAALNLAGTMLGFYPVRVLPSKTAIAPVNPTFLPRVRKLGFKTSVLRM